MTVPSDAALIDELTTIVSQAAAAILAARASALNTRTKADQSPVTAADDASEAIILEGMTRLLPGVPIISEEASARAAVGAIGDEFILVDPVDGTRELVAGRDEFSINLGLVRDGRAALGIVAAPALGLVWRTAAGGGAERFRLAAGCRGRRRERDHRDPDPADAQIRRCCRGQPLAFRCGDRRVPGEACDTIRRGDAAGERLGDQALPRRRGRGRRLSPAGADPSVGRGGGPRRSWPRPAASSPPPAGLPLSYRPADGLRVSGFIAWGDPSAACRLLKRILRRPAFSAPPASASSAAATTRSPFTANIALFSGV